MKEFSLNKALKEFGEITETPTSFLVADRKISDNIKTNIKKLYDFTKAEEIQTPNNPQPELFIKNLDSEQIWQQIDIQNEVFLTNFVNDISVILVNKNKLLFNNLEKDSQNRSNDFENESSENDDISDDSQNLGNKTHSDSQSKSNLSNSHTDDSSSDENDEETNKKKHSNSEASDNFFNLTEMENFLDMEEKKLADPDHNNQSESNESEEEDEVDLFEENSDEENDAKTARFKDYFVTTVENNKQSRKDKMRDSMKDNSDNEEEDPSDNEEENLSDNLKSNHEHRQERLKKLTDKLEGQAVSEKPWQLKGEITAENRPQNSLLEDIVGFDVTSRPAPVITEQVSFQLEDIIRQRIKDKLFDSVERKSKPTETPLEYKKKLVLDQEKSKQSLAQIYENEYFKHQAELDPENADREEEEPELHKKVKTMMVNVFTKLDALSNFHFTSKPPVPELKIVSHLPAISMEEVAPVAASDSTLLAPEEIKRKPKRSMIGKSERTSSEKKAERRKKKLKQKYINQLKVKKENSKKIGVGNKSRTMKINV